MVWDDYANIAKGIAACQLVFHCDVVLVGIFVDPNSERDGAGARIIQQQWTPYATDLYDLLIAIFSDDGKLANLEELKTKSALTDDEWQSLLMYSSQVWTVDVFAKSDMN